MSLWDYCKICQCCCNGILVNLTDEEQKILGRTEINNITVLNNLYSKNDTYNELYVKANINLQNNLVKRGTDQTVYNYLLQINNTTVEYSLPDSFWLMHMNRFNWFSHNWQLNVDTTPYFIKYGYIWVFSGFDRTQRAPLMDQTWKLIKQHYE